MSELHEGKSQQPTRLLQVIRTNGNTLGGVPLDWVANNQSSTWAGFWNSCSLFVDVESQVLARYTFAIYFAAIDIETEISLEIKSKYVTGSNAFDPA